MKQFVPVRVFTNRNKHKLDRGDKNHGGRHEFDTMIVNYFWYLLLQLQCG